MSHSLNSSETIASGEQEFMTCSGVIFPSLSLFIVCHDRWVMTGSGNPNTGWSWESGGNFSQSGVWLPRATPGDCQRENVDQVIRSMSHVCVDLHERIILLNTPLIGGNHVSERTNGFSVFVRWVCLWVTSVKTCSYCDG